MAPTNQQPRPDNRPLPGKGTTAVKCIIIALSLLALLVGAALLITYLTLKPKRHVYTIEAASVQDFAISDKDNRVNAKFNYVIKSNNPEKHVYVKYNSMNISTAYHNQTMAYKEISEHYMLRPKNKTMIPTQLVSNNVALSKSDAEYMRAEKSKGMIEMRMYIRATLRYKTWIFLWSSKRTLNVVCAPVMINVTSNSLDGFQKVTCKNTRKHKIL